jgi:preprotein translocase subunit SecY
MRLVVRGLGIRVVTTVLLPVASLVFMILYLAFFAHSYTWYQNLAIVLVTVIIVTGAIILMWLMWVMRTGKRFLEANGGWE